ncbi:MAG: hypothetical protein CBC42_03330 [Betaproteobacteria bacterium TMED82]|mgnify:CR=1 FL=1|nr:MAG: hypothetical protein CBC42_03330 [Betaproteobacteria bacterium TMED82]|tara:strand:- start:59185 stop:59553 length:369 start_codon:yes stop_codon:yes gene_type:complete
MFFFKVFLLCFVFCFSVIKSANAEKDEFPTIDRVLYVNECVREHGGGLDSLYKCSCVMDYFIDKLTYAEFDNMDASSHGINTTGERSAIWRDPKDVRDGISRLRKIQIAAKLNCNLKGAKNQ